MALQWQIRRDTAAQWSAENPYLAEGEWGAETDEIGTENLKIKIGDGINRWNDLDYIFNISSKMQVENFEATSGQTSFVVSAASIVDDGLSEVQVNGQIWNSRTGVASFTNGNISLDFITGGITFHVPLKLDDQVIIKYNK